MKRLLQLTVLLAILTGASAWGATYGNCSGSGLSWTCTSGATTANVQNTIDAASDGATISFASGSYSLADVALSQTKAVTLVGANKASTVTATGRAAFYIWFDPGTYTKRIDISGFTFSGGGETQLWFTGASAAGVAYISNIRIHDNAFTGLASGGIAIQLGNSGTLSAFSNTVIDSNTFSGTLNWFAVHHKGPNMGARPASLRGTNNNVFIEDNVFNFSSFPSVAGGSVLDGYQAQGSVVRFNTITNGELGSHGVTHGGVANYEAYMNTMTRNAGAADGSYRMLMTQGSGQLTWWGNTFTVAGTIHSSAIETHHYWSCSPQSLGYPAGEWQRCNGTGSLDGNLPGLSGWPCWMQPGRAPNGGGYGTLAPIYLWNNINTGTGAIVPLGFESCSDSPTVTTHIQANRDYYQAVSPNANTSKTSPFNGTTGMGYGPKANRPDTCSTGTDPENSGRGGVAYWATDEGFWNSKTPGTAAGVLYRCTAGNTWVVDYVPYPYPHPLRSGLAAPTGLTVQ